MDHVIVNGEGDFILGRRPTLWRTLMLIYGASAAGRKISLVNSLLSPPENQPLDADVVAIVGEALSRCDNVVYRDPESLRCSRQLYPHVEASYAPDALFTWFDSRPRERQIVLRGALGEGVSIRSRSLLKNPFIAISGGSYLVLPEAKKIVRDGLAFAIRTIRDSGFQALVLMTCDGDRWMRDVALEEGAAYTLPSIPLDVGFRLLSQASGYLTGRYHPSILAALAGTPTEMMASNSHKTMSLQEMLGAPTPTQYSFFGEKGDSNEVLASLISRSGRKADDMDRGQQTVARLAAASSALPQLLRSRTQDPA